MYVERLFKRQQHIYHLAELKRTADVKSDERNQVARPVDVILHSPYCLDYLLNGK